MKRLENDVTRLQDENSELKDENFRFKSSIDKQELEYATKIESFAVEVVRLKEEVQKQDSTIFDRNLQMRNLECKLRESEQQVSKLQNQLSQLFLL